MKPRWHVIATCGLVAGALALLALMIVGNGRSAQSSQAPLATERDAAPRPWKRYADASWPTGDFSRFNTLDDARRSPPVPKKLREPSAHASG